MKTRSIPGASQASHVNTSIFSFEKLNQLLLLLKGQLSSYPKELLLVTTNNHLLQIFAFRLLNSRIRGRNRGP